MIGTNKKDATETVALLLDDARSGLLAAGGEGTLEALLEKRGVDAVLYSGWEAIDAAERTAGEPLGRPRMKLCTWADLLAAARYRIIPRFGECATAAAHDRQFDSWMSLLECLRCGHTRSFTPGKRRHEEAGACPRCEYVGWAFSTDLTEKTRRLFRDLPLEQRLRIRTI